MSVAKELDSNSLRLGVANNSLEIDLPPSQHVTCL